MFSICQFNNFVQITFKNAFLWQSSLYKIGVFLKKSISKLLVAKFLYYLQISYISISSDHFWRFEVDNKEKNYQQSIPAKPKVKMNSSDVIWCFFLKHWLFKFFGVFKELSWLICAKLQRYENLETLWTCSWNILCLW